uniref:Rho GTPase activating protein 9 n=1 Tax=Pseudonaja textilis TaxID=8673 RepID=A0A670YM39_PSETE
MILFFKFHWEPFLLNMTVCSFSARRCKQLVASCCNSYLGASGDLEDSSEVGEDRINHRLKKMLRRFWEGFNHPLGESSLDSPGSVVLQALYDYQYKSEDGRQVIIEEGELFHLVHKANEDWWQVKRFGQPKQKRPIFVPASYVAEMSPLAMILLWTVGSLRPRTMRSLMASSRLAKPHKPPRFLRSQMLDDTPPPLLGEKPPIYYNLEEMKQLPATPPTPRSPPLQMLEAWEHHIDSNSLRSFYYKPTTGEKSWKPPRRSQEMQLLTLLNLEVLGMFCLWLWWAGLQFLFFSSTSRKCWASSWLVLAGNSLMFYKDPKVTAAWTPSGSRPESSVDLRGARIEWARDLSSKRNVIYFRTVTGNEYLLQSDNETVSQDWYQAIKGVIHRLVIHGNAFPHFAPSYLAAHFSGLSSLLVPLQDQENPLDEPLLYPLYRSNSAELVDLSWDDEDELGVSKGEVQAGLRPADPGPGRVYKKRVKSKLRRFIAKRPPLRSLQEKGLIRGNDVNLGRLSLDGLYRVNGNLAIIQKLRFIVDHERAVTSDGRYVFPEQRCQEEKLNLASPQWDDVHVITGALKLFFRELPESLVPYSYVDECIASVKLSDHKEKVSKLSGLIQSLPQPNRDTLHYLLQHLRRVMDHSDINRMTTQNIGIVFGPTLLRHERDVASLIEDMVYQNQVVELLLTEFTSIFGTDAE